MITVLERGGGYGQMITILHSGAGSLGTPKSDCVICARPLITSWAGGAWEMRRGGRQSFASGTDRTFFKPVPLVAKFGLFWAIFAILSSIYALFGALFTGLNSAVVPKNWQISGMHDSQGVPTPLTRHLSPSPTFCSEVHCISPL